MKYASIDIETLGISLDVDTIEIGIVIDDLSDPKPLADLDRLRLLLRHNQMTGEPYALGMHCDSGLIKEMQKYDRAAGPIVELAKNEFLLQSEVKDTFDVNSSSGQSHDVYDRAWRVVYEFLKKHDMHRQLKVAGKNFSTFDKPHLESKGWNIPFNIRFLDIGPLYMTDQIKKGRTWVPNLKQCLEYAGQEETVSHKSIEDALDVIKCVRYKLL